MALRNRNSARGAQVDCINFEMCPLCYGCRNANHLDKACSLCAEDSKNNLCNIKSHKAHLIAKMITKQQVNLNKEE